MSLTTKAEIAWLCFSVWEEFGGELILEFVVGSVAEKWKRRTKCRGPFRAHPQRSLSGHFAGSSPALPYDARAEYLTPPLQGWRLRAGEYRPLPSVTVLAGREVAVASEVLGLELRDEREARMVRLRDPATGQDLLTYEESEHAREEEAAARWAAETRVAELEARMRDLDDGMSP